ncbi:hypothetical protein Efla_000630 [Eimeria flavescens]
MPEQRSKPFRLFVCALSLTTSLVCSCEVSLPKPLNKRAACQTGMSCALALAATAGLLFARGSLGDGVEVTALSSEVQDETTDKGVLITTEVTFPSPDTHEVNELTITKGPSVRVYNIDEAAEDEAGQHQFAWGPASELAFLPRATRTQLRGRKLSSTTVGDYVYRVGQRINQRLTAATQTFVYPQYEEVRGQTYLAKYAVKLGSVRRKSFGKTRRRYFLKNLVNPQNGQAYDVVLSNGASTVSARFTQELQSTAAFTDGLAQESDSEWIGRFYVQSSEQDAAATLEKDFAILNCAPTGESIEGFRHRIRLNVPIQLYTIEGAGPYLQAPDGQFFINAVARRPLIQATAMWLLRCFCKKMRGSKKGRKALLSMSQQSVTAVSNLNCMGIVHTNINPNVFLVTQKGLVFLGGLQQAVTEGKQLPQPLFIEEGFVPPEIEQQLTSTATFAQDAWELGVTLYSFWCGNMTTEESDPAFVFPMTDTGAVNFSSCTQKMPEEMQQLITDFTQIDPASRLLPEKAIFHPAMTLPITGDTPTVDTDQDDEESDQRI